MLLKTKEETTQNIAKESLSSKITEEEIQVLLSGQAEIVELEKQLKLLQQLVAKIEVSTNNL